MYIYIYVQSCRHMYTVTSTAVASAAIFDFLNLSVSWYL